MSHFKKMLAGQSDTGQVATAAEQELSETAERIALNKALGLAPRQFYPVFRVTIEQVREAARLLRAGDLSVSRRYGAEKALYPHQSAVAVLEGAELIAGVDDDGAE